MIDMEAKITRQGTIEDIFALPRGERAELLNGVVYYMAPPSRTHQRIVTEVSRKIGNFIEAHHGECEVNVSPFAVFLYDDDSAYVEPDVVVVCDSDKLRDDGCHGAPDLVIEVVSPSSITLDYMIKFGEYQRAGVREYWIVDPSKSSVRVYNFSTGYTDDFSFSEEVKVGIFEGLAMTINELL